MSALLVLSDRELLEVYDKAINHDVEEEFIELLNEELKRRGLDNVS